MSQSDFGTIDPNTKSGSQLATDLNNFRNALNTLHSGATRPSYVQAGMLWQDTATAGRRYLKMYDGTDDIILGYIDTAANLFVVNIGGGTITGITPLGIAEGGTGASSVVGARANLNLAIGTNVQAWSAELDAIASLTGTGILVRFSNDVWGTRALSGTAPVVVTNGSGVAGQPVISVDIATEAEAVAGSSSTTLITPQRMAQAFDNMLIDQLTAARVGEATSGLGRNAVGSYAMCSNASGGSIGGGSTVAGGDLRFSIAQGGAVSGTPTGTWRHMGGSVADGGNSLFLRIS